MPRYLVALDLNRNELRNVRLHNLGTAPSSPVLGMLYFDTTLEYARVWDGTSWQRVAPEFLSDLGPAQGDLDLNGNRLTNVGAPTGDDDAATKGYVDGVAQGLDIKGSVRVATTGSITLSGTQTVDGISLVGGDRVLVKNQASAADNGIYEVAAGAWTRAGDFDSDEDVTAGSFVFVEEGTANSDSGWVLTSDNPLTVGTSDLTFAQFSGAGAVVAGDGLTKTGNTLDVGAGEGVVVDTNSVGLDWDATTPEDVGTTGSVGTSTQPSRGDHVHALPGDVGRVYQATLTGNASATEFVVTHNLGTKFVLVQVHDADSPFDVVFLDVEKTTDNTITLRFALPPANGKQYAVTVVG